MRVKGRHHQFRYSTRPGTLTVPHPRMDIAPGTLAQIERQTGLRLREE